MKMKNLIALAVAAAVMSPMAAMAANTPDNVGNVTLIGNIVANSPMWQWTVNDYPGPRLDAKPSEATTANGVTTYKLNGQKFIAVSGYLPSFSGIRVSLPGQGAYPGIGNREMTIFSDGHGKPIGNITYLDNGLASFTITAISHNTAGAKVEGTLTLNSTEIRGSRIIIPTSKNAYIIGDANGQGPGGGSCFGPIGKYTDRQWSGTPDAMTASTQSPTAFAAWWTAMQSADASGNVKWSDFSSISNGTSNTHNFRCGSDMAQSAGITNSAISTYKSLYAAVAHVAELQPIALSFNEAVSGAWNATLNVTAYQM